MNITEQTPIADIAASLPSSVRVFQRHGIDFCCGGKKPLGVVCEELGLSFEELSTAIRAAAAEPVPGRTDWTLAPLHALIDHIVATYHGPLREELPRLETMASRVAQVHGAHASYLSRVEQIVKELSSDLALHMQKEERTLFPAIREVEAGVPPSLPVGDPIHAMEHEHDHAGARLAELRRITGNYLAPDWACQTFRALYHGLAELEAQMHVHVHLENNVLFPRAQQRSKASA